ncbi:MAG: endonuclease/exonuclease/phosphatase family protein [Crocinitomicaceae bacterium]|nr:endonuclease/exonuclease/phosphatase family protein [Crocinitomicaceae bacterium]
MRSSLLQPMKGLRLIWKIFFFINVLFIFFLLLAYLSVYLDPSTFWWIAIFGLLYPISLISNFIFVLFWLFIKKSNALFSGLVMVLGLFYFLDFFALHPFPQKAPENSVKIMSYNVRLFDLYNWKGNKETKQQIFDFLVRENADIICFQEFYENKGEYGKTFKTTSTLVEILDSKNHFEKYTHKMTGDQYFGVATYTKYPIVNKGIVPFDEEETNACIYTDIKIDNDTIRVYNTHMGSIRFNADDYKYFGDENTQFKPNVKGGENIFGRLKKAYKKRIIQATKILDHSKTSPYKVLICGDFNDIPISYTYHQFEKLYKDAFLESGFGIGKTYIGKIPSYRIDYIWMDEAFQSYEFKVHEEELSDHRAISCFFNLK